MLSVLLNYGAELGLVGCLELAQVLERMTLRVPKDIRATWKAKRPPKLAMSYEQAAAVPEGQRRGPLVTDDSGMPVRRRYNQDLYRDVADAAGVPRAVWNMLARHGGATEARQAGVALADIAEHVQHADLNTTRKHYIVPSVETSRRVAKCHFPLNRRLSDWGSRVFTRL
jgi:hypothetical protein